MNIIQRTVLILPLAALSASAWPQETSFSNADGFYSIGTQSNRTASISLVDIDQDGDLDALVANGRHWAEQNYLFYNNGKGRFKTAQPVGRKLDASYAMKSADFNQDGYMDIAVVNDNVENRLYFGSIENRYEDGIPFGSIAPSRNLEVVDIDKDGDFDLIISNRKAKNEVCLNDGKGNFSQILFFGNDSDQTIQTKAIDMNDDGQLDLVTAERKSKNRIYLYQGDQHFATTVTFGGESDESRSVDVGDMDQDGFVDVVVGNLRGANQIYFGDRQLTFSRTHTFKQIRNTASVRVADFNQDGLPDIAEGNSGNRNFVHLNIENNKFVEIGLGKDIKDDTYNIEIGDIDNNGLPDIVESNSEAQNLYYRTREKQDSRSN